MGGFNSAPTPSGGGEFNPALDSAGGTTGGLGGLSPPAAGGFSMPQVSGGGLDPAEAFAPAASPMGGGLAPATSGLGGGFGPDLSPATGTATSGFSLEQTNNFSGPRKVEGLKPDIGRGVNMPLQGSLLGGSEPAKPTPAPKPLAFKPAPLDSHTVNTAGRAEHQNWAKLLSETNDYRGALPVLNRTVKDFGLQGQGDVADVLGHLNALAPKAAEAVRDGIFQGTGIRVPMRIAPDGPGFDPKSVQPALPKTNPWGAAEGADPQAAAGMAKVLLTKGDYAQGAVPHFQGEFARDPEATRAYTAAVYDEMAKSDPQSAALFARQMGEGGLVPAQDPTATINDLGKRALGGNADAVRDLATTYTDLLNADEAAAAKVAQGFGKTYGVPIEAAFELGKPARPAAGRSYSEAEVLGDWKSNVEDQTGMRLTEAATQDRNGQSSNRVDADGSGRKEAVAPIINLKADRIKNVKADAPARFEIRPNPGAKGEVPWYSHHNRGYDAVKKHGAAIDEEAKKQGVDPDLVRAIMYMENADGHKFGANDLADFVGISDSKMPMNIRPDIWGELGLDAESAKDPKVNIRASVTLIRRIQDRIDDPTPEKVATLWNNISKEEVSDLGARVGRYYKERQWEKPYRPSSGIVRPR